MFANIIRILSVIIVLSIWLIPVVMKHSLSDSDREYMTHFEAGYSCFQKKDYDCAMSEYNKAYKIYSEDRTLYIRIAWVYERIGLYDDALKYAKKALKFPESKSIYKRANGFMFPLHEEISIYDIIGKASLETGNFNDAISAYKYVLEHNSFKYSDAHYYLGQAYLGLGDNRTALDEFMHHKATIEEYLSDDVGTYYTQTDIDNVNQWINIVAGIK